MTHHTFNKVEYLTNIYGDSSEYYTYFNNLVKIIEEYGVLDDIPIYELDNVGLPYVRYILRSKTFFGRIYNLFQDKNTLRLKFIFRFEYDFLYKCRDKLVEAIEVLSGCLSRLRTMRPPLDRTDYCDFIYKNSLNFHKGVTVNYLCIHLNNLTKIESYIHLFEYSIDIIDNINIVYLNVLSDSIYS